MTPMTIDDTIAKADDDEANANKEANKEANANVDAKVIAVTPE